MYLSKLNKYILVDYVVNCLLLGTRTQHLGAIKKYHTTPVNNKCCQLSSACFAKLMCGLAQNAPGQPHIGANLLAATTTANIGVQV